MSQNDERLVSRVRLQFQEKSPVLRMLHLTTTTNISTGPKPKQRRKAKAKAKSHKKRIRHEANNHDQNTICSQCKTQRS